MSGTKILIDTNISLYMMGGDEILSTLLDGKEIFVSVITEMELLSYPKISLTETISIKNFLKDTLIIDINEAIKEITIELRKYHNLKLPDAMIAATAQYLNIPLISSDQAFKKISSISFILYEL